MKKFKIFLVAGLFGATAYFCLNTNYKKIPDCFYIFRSVVFGNNTYSDVLLSELLKEKNEKIAEQMIEGGYQIKKQLFSERKPAPGFIKHPYDLRIIVEHSSQGEMAYILDLREKRTFPIYEGVQVGDLEHRLKGLPEIINSQLLKTFEQTKMFFIDKLDSYLNELKQY